MSKSNKQVLLSPENYIRQKSRNLPIVKCLINKKWKDEGVAAILIVRQHSNGNFTFCFYLVDKDCLGVKETLYRFNVPQEVLDEDEKLIRDSSQIEEISYDLAHNIIFAAVEFAEEYGFKPHKDFTSVTKYFLEEDDDNIPLINIQCGNEHGQPLYVTYGNESPAKRQQIINQLEKTAGKGNYEFYIIPDKEEDDDEFDDDDDEFDDDEVYNRWHKNLMQMDDQEFGQISNELLSAWIKRVETDNYDSNDEELLDKMRALTDIFSKNDMYNEDKTEEYYEQIISDLENIDTVDADDVPNSLFPTFVGDGMDVADDFYDTFFEIHSNSKKKEKQKSLANFRLEYKDCGAFAYLKFMLNSETKEKELADIEKELEKFPNYFLLQMLQKEIETAKMSSEQAREEWLNLAKDRTITTFEMSQLLMYYSLHVLKIADGEAPDRLEKLIALEMLLDDDFSDEKCDHTDRIVLTMVRVLKINQIIALIITNKLGLEDVT
jgi:hypothetical protein